MLLVVTLLAAGAAGVLLVVPGGHAQVQITLEPSMTKGAASGAVTIVEFSDYQ